MTTQLEQPQFNMLEGDLEAIRRAALDYIEGGYEADAEKMERSLHPELAKRIVVHQEGLPDRLSQMSALTLVQAVRSWPKTPAERQRKEVYILDATSNSAVVKLIAQEWVDFMHLTRFNGRWVIVNVLWEMLTGQK
jgi:hypothetical protein